MTNRTRPTAKAHLLLFAMALLVAPVGSRAQTAAPSEPPRSEILARAARAAVARRDWNTALERFREAVELAPKDYGLRREFAGVLFQAGQVARSLEEYDRILEQQPGDKAAQDEAVAVCMAVQDFDGLLQRLLKYRPGRENERDFMLKLARAYAWTGQPAQAALVLDALQRNNPDDREIYAEYLAALMAARMWGEFAAKSEPFLQKWPDDEQVRLFRVDALLIQDRIAEALDLLKQMTRDLAKAPEAALIRVAEMRLTCGEPPAQVRPMLEEAARGRKAPELQARLATLYAYDGAFHLALAKLEAARQDGASSSLLAATRAELLALGQMPRAALEEYSSLLNLAEAPSVRVLKGMAEAACAIGKSESAKAFLRRAVIQHPGDVDAALRYVQLLADRGEIAQGLAIIGPVADAHRGNPSVRLLRARLLAAAGQADKAEEDYDFVLEFIVEKGPSGAVASGLFPLPYLEAVPSDLLRRAVERAPEETATRALYAAALLREGRVQESVDEYERLAAAGPGAVPWRLGLAQALAAKGIADAQRRARLDALLDELGDGAGLDRRGLATLAELLARLEKWEALRRVAARMLQDQPDDGYATALLAGALMSLGQQQEAEAAIATFLAASPENPLSELALCSRLGYIGRTADHPAYATASQRLNALAEANPRNMDIRQVAGQLAATHGEFDRARELLAAVAIGSPNDPQALLWRARVESWDEHYDESLRFYDEYEAANPADWKVHLERARVLGWALRYDDAFAEYRRGVERAEKASRSDPAAGNWAPMLELEREAKRANWERRERAAISYYDRLLLMRPDDPEILFDRGQMDTRLGFSRRAEDFYDRALAMLDARTLSYTAVRDAMDFEQARRKAHLIQAYDFRREKGFNDLFEITEHLITTTLWSPESESMWRLGAELQEGFYSFEAFPDPFAERLRLMARKRFDNGLQLDAWVRGGRYTETERTTLNAAVEARYKAWDRLETTLGADRLDVVENFRTLDRDIQADRLRMAIGTDLGRRFRIEGNGAFVHFEDDNDGIRAGASVSCELVRYPRLLKISYGADYWDFKHQGRPYFSPSQFWQHGPMLHWRHYLNERHYSGVNEIYYGIKLPLRFDSDGEAYFGGALEFLWDITHNWQVGAEVSAIFSSPYDAAFSRIWVQWRF